MAIDHIVSGVGRTEEIIFADVDTHQHVAHGYYMGNDVWEIHVPGQTEPAWRSEPIDNSREGWEETIKAGYSLLG